MTREQREVFVREQIFQTNTWEEAVQNIVNRWEDDVLDACEDAFTRGTHAGQESGGTVLAFN